MNARLLEDGEHPDKRTLQSLQSVEQDEYTVVVEYDDGEVEHIDGYLLVGVVGIDEVWLQYEGSIIHQNGVERAFETSRGELRVYCKNGRQHSWTNSTLVAARRDA